MGLSASSGNRAAMNVTPLIDVVLVLLIVFMVASPLLMRSVPVEVPPRAETPDVVPARPALVVTLGTGGHVDLAIGASLEQLSVLEVPARLRAVELDRYDVFVDFHGEVPYREAVALSDTLRGVGVDPVRLVMR